MYNTQEDKQILYSRGGSVLVILDGRNHKCRRCWVIISSEHLEGGKCPVCGTDQDLVLMCERDHTCTCLSEVNVGLVYCPDCGEAVCPGYNRAKQQEVKDRTRYNALTGAISH